MFVTYLKGKSKRSNQGLFYVMLLNMALNQQLFQKELMARGDDACNSTAPVNKLVDKDVAPHMSSFLTWYRETARLAHDAIGERIAMVATGGRCRLRNKLESAIKARVKTGALPADALNQSIFRKDLSSITVQITLEQSELAGLTEQAQPNEDNAPYCKIPHFDHD